MENVITTPIITKSKSMILKFGITINPEKVFVVSENIVLFYGQYMRIYDCKRNSCLLKDKERNGFPVVTIDNKTVIIRNGYDKENKKADIMLLDVDSFNYTTRSVPFGIIDFGIQLNTSQILFITTELINDYNYYSRSFPKINVVIYDYLNDTIVDCFDILLEININHTTFSLLNDKTLLCQNRTIFHIVDLTRKQIVFSYKVDSKEHYVIFPPMIVDLNNYTMFKEPPKKLTNEMKVLFVNHNEINAIYDMKYYNLIIDTYKNYFKDNTGGLYPILDNRIFIVISKKCHYVIDTEKGVCIQKIEDAQCGCGYFTNSYFVCHKGLRHEIFHINKQLLQCYLDGTLQKKGELYCKTILPISSFFGSLFSKK